MSPSCPSSSACASSAKSGCSFGWITTYSARCALILIALLLSATAEARSATERRAFANSHPCPSTGELHGKCPGYVVDHIIPLCAGGPDNPSNMQWQALEASKAKDKQEWRHCRGLRRGQYGNHQL